MRKSTIILGLGLALAGADVAAAQATARPERPQAGAAHDGTHHKGEGRGFRHDGRGPGALLKGITLSDAQKQRLQELRRSQAPSEAERAQLQKAREELRALRQRGDTAAARARMEQLRAQGQQRQEQHLAALRAILTPEQQRQFDANVAEWKQRAAQHGEGRRGERRGGERR